MITTQVILKVGDRVMWRGSFGTDEPVPAVIIEIEYCANGGKYGDPVREIRFEHKNNCIFSLANGHWCRGSQIVSTL